MDMMKAAVYEKYGAPEVVKLKEVLKPSPKEDEILIKIHSTTVNAADWRLRSLSVPKGFGLLVRLFIGIFGPRRKILGATMAGTVEAMGPLVTKFNIGDKVFASCGFGFGGHAEYKTIKQHGSVALLPENTTFEVGAAICFGGTTANKFLQQAKIKQGEKVLINGASGSTGTAFIQLAKYYGAEVTAVCSAVNIDLVTKLGADFVIDYTIEDFSINGQQYDIIVDTAGTAPWSRSKNSLTSKGRLILVLGDLLAMLQAPFVSRKAGKSIIDGASEANSDELNFLAKLVSEGFYTPVIDRVYAFENIVEAHAYVDTGRKKGNVIINI